MSTIYADLRDHASRNLAQAAPIPCAAWLGWHDPIVGWRLFRRVRIAPGVRINLSRSGPSLSLGPRGFTRTFGPRGTRTTVGIPGTGVYYTKLQSNGRGSAIRRRCPRCKRPVALDASFCPYCGTRL